MAKDSKGLKITGKALAAALAINTVCVAAAKVNGNTPKPNIPNQPLHMSSEKQTDLLKQNIKGEEE